MDWCRIICQILSKVDHFSSEKCSKFLQYIGCRSAILGGPKLNFIYVVQLFLLYKMVKKYLKKNGMLVSKHASHYSNFTDFWWFFNKNQIFLAIFIIMRELYSKMDVLFGISVKNCIESHIFWKKFFSVENSPVVPHSSHFFLILPPGPLGANARKRRHIVRNRCLRFQWNFVSV